MQKAPNALTKKVGPLPVYAYALAALGLFLFLRSQSASTSSTSSGLPALSAGSGSASQQPASGQGNAADNASGDLLAALGQQTSSYDALIAALQYGGSSGFGGFGGTSVPPGFGGGGGGSTSAVTAPTVTDAGVTPQAALSLAPGTVVPASGSGDPFTGGAPGGVATGDPEHNLYITGGSDVDPFNVTTTPVDNTDAVSRYLSNHNVETTFSAAPVSSPTPTVVQPAPADTTSVFTPRPTPGHNVAV